MLIIGQLFFFDFLKFHLLANFDILFFTKQIPVRFGRRNFYRYEGQ